MLKANISTSYALTDATNYTTCILDNRKFTIGFFIDLMKAVDTVDHKIRLNKLEF